MTRRATIAAAAAALLLWPARAHAHLVTTGLGPLYDGISHLFTTFDDWLPALAMAALAGLNGAPAGRRALFALPAAWLAGGLAGFLAGAGPVPAGATAASLLVLGTLTAADRRLSPAVVTALAAVIGLLHGWLNGVGIADAGREASGLVGIAAAVFVLAALAAAAVVSLRRPWTRIVVRVAGSWMAAIGLLLLGWALRGQA